MALLLLLVLLLHTASNAIFPKFSLSSAVSDWSSSIMDTNHTTVALFLSPALYVKKSFATRASSISLSTASTFSGDVCSKMLKDTASGFALERLSRSNTEFASWGDDFAHAANAPLNTQQVNSLSVGEIESRN